MFLVTTSSDVEKDSCLMSDIFRLTLNNDFFVDLLEYDEEQLLDSF